MSTTTTSDVLREQFLKHAERYPDDKLIVLRFEARIIAFDVLPRLDPFVTSLVGLAPQTPWRNRGIQIVGDDSETHLYLIGPGARAFHGLAQAAGNRLMPDPDDVHQNFGATRWLQALVDDLPGCRLQIDGVEVGGVTMGVLDLSPAAASVALIDKLATTKRPTDDTGPSLGGEERALAILVKHPDWTDTQIADAAGVSRTSLYRMTRYTQARRVTAEHGRRTRGQRQDAQTGIDD